MNPDAARDLEHLAASFAASFAVMAGGEERAGPIRGGRVKRSSVKQGLDGEAAEMVYQDHVRAASHRAERAVGAHSTPKTSSTRTNLNVAAEQRNRSKGSQLSRVRRRRKVSTHRVA